MPNGPMKRKTAQVAFVFEYLYGTMRQSADFSWSGGCDTRTTYDDGADFVSTFSDKFPGRKPDGNATLASARLGVLCRQLYQDGWLERFRLSNYDQYHPGQEPNWQYVYSVAPEYANKLKSGAWTTEYMARRYEGDGDPWEAIRPNSPWAKK